MEQLHAELRPAPTGKDFARDAAARDYVLDMIREMARLARRNGDRDIAIHLEAIIAARHAAAEDQVRWARPRRGARPSPSEI